jgi:hypothetical protein
MMASYKQQSHQKDNISHHVLQIDALLETMRQLAKKYETFMLSILTNMPSIGD